METTTIYTTQRCLAVEETYDAILMLLNNSDEDVFELTEVMSFNTDTPPFMTSSKRKVAIQKKYIVEIQGQTIPPSDNK